MKRTKLTITLGSLAAFFLLFSLMVSGAWADLVNLRISTQMPPNHHTVKALEIFKQEVEKNAAGRIKVSIHPAGQLFKGRELPMAVGSGAVEIGDMVTPYLSGIFPELELLDGPFMVDSRPLAENIFSGEIGEMLNKRIESLGMKVIFGHPYGYFSMYGNNKKAIKLPSDMEGMKIRAVGETQVLKAKAMGAKPQTIPGSEQYMAYKQGVVDVGQSGPSSFVSRKLYEVFKHGTVVRDDLMMFWCNINLKVWKKLSDADKKIIIEAGKKAAAYDWEVIEKEENEADDFLPTKMNMYFPKDQELQEWKRTFAPVNKQLAENTGKRGLALYNAILQVRKEMGLK
ncbi:MAG: TRAP transporter substrate-binding protein DctP [Desulfobacterales bacterium]|nr:TRAP transporter substrate-binding protein DctP [Desulfobacterales bacterium]